MQKKVLQHFQKKEIQTGNKKMKVINKLSPNDEQLNGFVEGDVETPIAMVNLLKFKEKAEYEDGRDTNLSGAEAYAIYAEKVASSTAIA